MMEETTLQLDSGYMKSLFSTCTLNECHTDQTYGSTFTPLYSLPNSLTYKPSSLHTDFYGIWTLESINCGTRFGPYIGFISEDVEEELVAEMKEKLDETPSNWLEYVNHALIEEQQNLLLFKFQQQIYYISCIDIPPNTELLVGYRDENGKEVQKRWKNMKDSYFKSIRNQDGKSGDQAKPRRPYLYHKQMSFLQSVTQPRETSGTMNINETDDVVESPQSETPVSMQKSSQLPNKRKADAFEKEIVSFLQANNECLKLIAQQNTAREPDPDEMFLLSQLPVIKRMRPTDKLEFQIQFMNLLQSFSKPAQNFPMCSYNTYSSNSSRRSQQHYISHSTLLGNESGQPVISDEDSILSVL